MQFKTNPLLLSTKMNNLWSMIYNLFNGLIIYKIKTKMKYTTLEVTSITKNLNSN